MRFIFTIALLFASVAGASVTAQNSASEQNRLHGRLEACESRCDSLARLLAQTRERYRLQEAERSELAPRIIALEVEEQEARQAYEEALARFAAAENVQLSGNVNAANSSVPAVEEQTSVVVKQRANLVVNAPFVEALSVADHKALCEAQRREKAVVSRIKECSAIYDSMVALALEYQRVDLERSADSLMVLVESKRAEVQDADARVGREWQQVYDNKVYLYNLMLEKLGYSEVLNEGERMLAAAAIEVGGDAIAAVEAPSLATYYLQKRALLDYETRIAAAIETPKAKDSLQRVSKALNRSAYTLSKVVVERRAFIDHEPLKVIKPTIYTSKNPIPQTKIYDYGTVYRIRIGIFTNRPNLSALKGITPLSYTSAYHGGKYSYFVGGFRTEAEAEKGVKYLKSLGFRDPVVVMWVNGEYISNIAEWKRTHATGYNIEISGIATLPSAVKAHIELRNESCHVLRVGSSFVAGPFANKAEADKVAAEIEAMESRAKVAVVDLKTK